MRDDRVRLEDIRDAIEQVEKYACGGRQAFDGQELVRVWILHHLQIVGEACSGLSEEFRRLHPDEVWADAAGFRNILVHHYFGIDDEAVSSVVERDLPALKLKVNQVLQGD